MRIKKTYTVTESEKNRIRGLHNNVKNLLREGTGEICEDCGKVHEGACGGETYEDYELEEVKEEKIELKVLLKQIVKVGL